MRTIYINSAQKDTVENNAILIFNISVDTDGEVKNSCLTYSFDSQYKDILCDEVADGVVVTLLSYAMRGGYDIESTLPITNRLFYTLNWQLIPQLVITNKVYATKVKGVTLKPDWHPKSVATAMSCGVDSLTTFYEYSADNIPSEYKITHLTFFQNGAHHAGNVGHSKKEREIFENQLKHVKAFCDVSGYQLITVRSNLDEFLSKMFWKDSFDNTHTYRNVGFALLMQKLIRVYYYSPAYNSDHFVCSMTSDAATYERLLLPNISSEYLIVYNTNGLLTRLDKIKLLAEKAETYKYLLVCYKGGSNCGRCIKCKRTLVELDITGELDKYKDRFELEEYYKNRNKILVWTLSKRHDDELMNQIYCYIKENKIPIPYECYIKATIRMLGKRLVDYTGRLFSKLNRNNSGMV